MAVRRQSGSPAGVDIRAPLLEGFEDILTPEALAFVADLARRFSARVSGLLEARADRQAAIDAGQMPDFLAATRSIREAAWQVTEVPADLWDRRVEI
nr:malate synthase A [Gammaproteobacteria bacterium]